MSSRLLGSVAADANVLLSALIGKAALRVFLRSPVTVVTTAFNVSEVEEYLPLLAVRYGMIPEVLEAQLQLLPLTVYQERFYRDRLADASRLIAGRDPDDIHLVALALKLGIPVWSNDRDLQGLEIEVLTTAQLLKRLASG